MELDTGGNSLPCSLLGIAWDELKPLAPRSRFCGHVWANETPGGWAAQLEGKLEGLDLAGAAGRTFPAQAQRPRRTEHRLGAALAGTRREGRRNASRRARTDRQLAGARGRRASCTWWLAAEPKASGDARATSNWPWSFHLDAGGVRLHGCCTGVATGTVLAGPRRAAAGRADRPAAAGGSPDPGPRPGQPVPSARHAADRLAGAVVAFAGGRCGARYPPCPATSPSPRGPGARAVIAWRQYKGPPTPLSLRYSMRCDNRLADPSNRPAMPKLESIVNQIGYAHKQLVREEKW